MEVPAGTRYRALLIETGTLLAEKANGDAVINGDHVVEPCKIMQVICVADIIHRKVVVPVDRVIIPLHIDGESKSIKTLAAIGGKSFISIGYLTRFNQLDKAGIEHLCMDAKILKAGISHGADTSRGQ